MIANATEWTYDVGPPFLDTTLHPMAMGFMGLLNIILYELTHSRTSSSSYDDVPHAAGLQAYDDGSYDYEDNFINDSGVTQDRNNDTNLSLHQHEELSVLNQQDNFTGESFNSEHTSPNTELFINNNLRDNETDIWDVNSSINEIKSNSNESGETDSLETNEELSGGQGRELLVESAKNETENSENQSLKNEEIFSSKEETKSSDKSDRQSKKSSSESRTTNNLEQNESSLHSLETGKIDSGEKTRDFMKQLQKVRFQFRKGSKSSSESMSSSISSDSLESQEENNNQRSKNDIFTPTHGNTWDEFSTNNGPENKLQFLGPFMNNPFEKPLSIWDLIFDMPKIQGPFGMMDQIPNGMRMDTPNPFCELNECDIWPPTQDNRWLPNQNPSGSNFQAMIRRDGAIPTSPFYTPKETIYDQEWNPFVGGFNENTGVMNQYDQNAAAAEEIENLFAESPNEEDELDDDSPVVLLIFSRFEHTIYPGDILTPEDLDDCPQEPFLPDIRMEATDLSETQVAQNAPIVVNQGIL